jgi:hypothetical protein
MLCGESFFTGAASDLSHFPPGNRSIVISILAFRSAASRAPEGSWVQMRTPARNAKLWLYSALCLGMQLLLGASSLSAHNSSIFNGPRDYLVGSYPESVVVADFNDDGRPDIATANQSSKNVSILLQKQ